MEKFYSAIAEILDINPSLATDEFILVDGIWDSLSMVSTIAFIDESYGVIINGNDLVKCNTIGDITALIVKEKNK